VKSLAFLAILHECLAFLANLLAVFGLFYRRLGLFKK